MTFNFELSFAKEVSRIPAKKQQLHKKDLQNALKISHSVLIRPCFLGLSPERPLKQDP